MVEVADEHSSSNRHGCGWETSSCAPEDMVQVRDKCLGLKRHGVRDERSGSEGHRDDHSSSMQDTESRQGVARRLGDWAAAVSESLWCVLEYR